MYFLQQVGGCELLENSQLSITKCETDSVDGKDTAYSLPTFPNEDSSVLKNSYISAGKIITINSYMLHLMHSTLYAQNCGVLKLTRNFLKLYLHSHLIILS